MRLATLTNLVDPACPLNLAHPLNRGLLVRTLCVHNTGLVGGNKVYNSAKPAIVGTMGSTKPTWVGSRLSFASGNAVVDFGNPAALQLSAAVTLSCWIYAFSWDASYDYFVSKEQTSSPYNAFTIRNEGASLQWCTGIGGVENKLGVSRPSLNEWHFIAGTFDGATKYIYVDGIQAGSSSNSGTLLNASGNFTIGDSYAYTGRAFHNGKIRDVSLYNRALSSVQIMALYKEQKAGNPETLNWLETKKFFGPISAAPSTFQAAWAVNRSGILGGGVC